MKNCLVVGTGGVGGSLAAMLALAGVSVTCIVRGKNQEAMLQHGLKFHSDMFGEKVIPCRLWQEKPDVESSVAAPFIQVADTSHYQGKADLILVCVKGYSIQEVAPCIQNAAQEHTLVLPILNVFGSGDRLAACCPGVSVLDGCIYIVGFVSAPGEITQQGKFCKLVFGARPQQPQSLERLEEVQKLLEKGGIEAVLSHDILRDTFRKWSFISAMACTGAYFRTPMRAVQQEGPERELFKTLSHESGLLGETLGYTTAAETVKANLRVIDHVAPQSTSSMQKDLAAGHQSEIDGLLYGMLRRCREAGIQTPAYQRMADAFAERKE